jgi:zinc protease
MRRLSILALTLAILAYAGSADAKVFSPSTVTLDNGLQVVVIEDHIAPVVTQMVWYKVGSADEIKGKSGIAHFLEHLMFKGTAKLKPQEFSKIVARNGGNDNAFTSWDYTAYFQSIAKDRLPLVMGMEADRMQNLRLSDAVVNPERNVILSERRQTLESSPGARLNEAVNAAFYLNNPYHTPIIGWRSEMEKLTTQDALDWYRKWYAPNNAVLVISGDVTMAEVKPLAEKYFGPIPRKAIPERNRPIDPPDTTERLVMLRDGQVHQPAMFKLFPAPNYRTAEGREGYALELAAEIVGGDSASRLYNHLVVEQRIATSVAAEYSQDSLDPNAFEFYASPASGIDLHAVESAINGEIASLVKDGVSEDELAAAKKKLIQDATLSRDSVSGPAHILGEELAIGRSIADVEEWPDRIAGVTKADVDAALKNVLVGKATTGELLPSEGFVGSDAAPVALSPASMGGPIR